LVAAGIAHIRHLTNQAAWKLAPDREGPHREKKMRRTPAVGRVALIDAVFNAWRWKLAKLESASETACSGRPTH